MNTIKNLLKSFLFIFIYLFIIVALTFVLYALKIDLDNFVFNAFVVIFSTIIFYFIYHKRIKIPWKSETGVSASFVWILITVFLDIAVAVLITQFISNGTSKTTDELVDLGMLGVLFGVIVAPITEELVYRAMLSEILKDSSNIVYALISSFFFGLMHAQKAETFLLSIFPVLITGAIGFVHALVYRKTKSIYIPIISHTIYNSIVFALSFAVKF